MKTTEDVKSKVQQYWDDRASDFDQGPSHGLHNDAQHMAWRNLLKSTVGTTPIDILDIGCGTGFLALLLAELGHRAVGVDLSEAMLSEARRKAATRGYSMSFHWGDAEAPPAGGARYDLITERHLIWTLPNPGRAVDSWLSLLRPGGRLLMIEGDWDMPVKPEYQEIHGNLPFYGGRPGDEIAAFLRDHGYQDPIVEPLMDSALWLEAPSHPRYMVLARRRTT